MKLRKPTKLGIAGTFMGSLGVVSVTWGSIKHFDPVRVGIVLLIVGVTLMCFQSLKTKNLAADEIYNIGRERGHEDGYEEGYREGMAYGERRRPSVVVPMPTRCDDCGHVMKLVGSVADRG